MSDKLTIRDWQESDMAKLAEFHAQMNVGYSLPESFGPLFAVQKAVVNESGDVVAMATVKIIGEAFFWVDPTISAVTRTKSVTLLNSECQKAARMLGLEEVSCWIPEKIAQCFSGILEKLGWSRSPWRTWSFPIR